MTALLHKPRSTVALELTGGRYRGENPPGVALSALMRIPKERIVWLGAEALRRLAGARLSDQNRFLLSECVDTYLPLDEAQQEEFEQMLQTETYTEVRSMNLTTFEKGMRQDRFGSGAVVAGTTLWRDFPSDTQSSQKVAHGCTFSCLNTPKNFVTAAFV